MFGLYHHIFFNLFSENYHRVLNIFEFCFHFPKHSSTEAKKQVDQFISDNENKMIEINKFQRFTI